MTANIIKGTVQFREQNGQYFNVEVNQGNPRYPVRIGVSESIYNQVKEGQVVEFENVVVMAKVSKSGNAYLSCFIPKPR